MIQKFTVTWLLCLFVWNVALAEVPSLLLCLHHDFAVHIESEESNHGHCEDGHEHAESQEVEHCVVKDDCTDLELQGGESIPARLDEVHVVDLPVLTVAEFCYADLANSKVDVLSRLQLRLRGPPPSVHWLTDIVIKKTVLRV
ncbi:MAG: hypothetical protein P8R37_12830 [Opitutae bacterium]|nr:hypothetical protein [Opitutae bacterium]